MRYAGHSQKGKKHKQNQDRILLRPLPGGGLLLAVADGMGGEPAGDLASQIAVDALAELPADHALKAGELVKAAKAACRTIYRKVQGQPELEGCGTTLTVVGVAGGVLVWAHVGDSRFYILRGGRLRQVTSDHTAAAFMVEEGQLTPEEAEIHPARHMLFDCVGCGECEPDSGEERIEPGDVLLLASDGFYDRLDETEIIAGFEGADDLQAALAGLAAQAVARGSRDDISAVVARI